MTITLIYLSDECYTSLENTLSMEEKCLYGYAGRVLHIDLTTGKTHVEPLNEEYAKKYIGGIGLGMRLWLDYSKPGVEPFSPENPLILAIGQTHHNSSHLFAASAPSPPHPAGNHAPPGSLFYCPSSLPASIV